MVNEEQNSEETKEELKAQLELMNKAMQMVQDQIKVEQAMDNVDPQILQDNVNRAQSKLDDIKAQIDARKARARELKDRITAMKEQHEALPEDQQAEDWLRISDEIRPMGAEIIQCETEIGALELQKYAAEHEVAMASVRLEAQAAVMATDAAADISLEDPRLAAVRAEKHAIEEKLRAAQGKVE